MTGVTIPDMVKIVKRHGLVPVPLDIDPETLAPSMEVRAAYHIGAEECVYVCASIHPQTFCY